MKVLIAHNYYQQPGGEDSVFTAEAALLESFGHTVTRFAVHNDAIDQMGKLQTLKATIWNRRGADELAEVVRQAQPEVVHFHNTFPLISPAGYAAARAGGAAVVQTLHNYRLVCPCAVLFRDGKPCEDCLGKRFAWPGVARGCYRDSRVASLVVAANSTIHHAVGTWRNAVDAYIAPSAFAREKLIAGGLPGEKILVKPNFLHPDPGVGPGGGGYAVFVGRLSFEKGLPLLIAAWESQAGSTGSPQAGSTSSPQASVPLKIIGDGPLADGVRAATAKFANVQWLGRRTPEEVYDIVGRAALLVLPSQCYETFGRVAIEAFARGTPVVATGHGAMSDVVAHGRTGRLFKPGDAADLAKQVRELLADPAALARMRTECRKEFEANYTGARSHEQLMSVYQSAIRNMNRSLAPGASEEYAEAPAL